MEAPSFRKLGSLREAWGVLIHGSLFGVGPRDVLGNLREPGGVITRDSGVWGVACLPTPMELPTPVANL